MKQKKQILKAEKTLSMSKKTRERILTIAKDIKEKNYFLKKMLYQKKH